MIWSKFYTEDPQILSANIKNLEAEDLCTPVLEDASD
jgi:hypothetical protein